MKRSSIWTPFAIIFLGFWLMSGALSFGLDKHTMIGNDLICGFLLIFLGFLSRPQSRWWTPWVISLLGVWLQFAPLIFWADAAGYLNDTAVGALAILFSVIIPDTPGQLPDIDPSVPPGWSYNPSSWAQRLPIAAFACIGWFISRYLAAYQMGHIDSVWDPFFADGTLKVITSDVAKDFPVPDAGLGAMAYAIEAILTCQGGKSRWRTSPWMVVIFGILVVPASLVSITLIILQPIVVGAWCTLCLITALCMLIPIPLGIDEVAVVLQYLKNSKEKPFLKLFFFGGLCPKASDDQRSPEPSEPLRKLLRASCWGITVPWNLLLSTFCGILLMLMPWAFHIHSPLQDIDHIIGPLTIVISVVSMAEVIRKARFINVILALILICGSFIFQAALVIHLVLGVVIAATAFRRGPVKEKTSYI